MQKRILWILAVILSVLLCSCGQEPSEVSTTGTATEERETTVTTATEPTTEPSTEPPPSLAPVTLLNSIRWKTFPEFLSLGNGNVLACQNYFEEGSGIINFLDIFNVYDDRVLFSNRNETPRELVQQQFVDGCFVLSDPATHTFYVYDQQLQEVSSFSVPNTEGYFSHDRRSYYFVEDRVLYCMDVDSGNYGRVALQEDLRLERLMGLHPDRDILCASVYLSFYQDYCGMAVIDCTTGELLVLREDIAYLWFHADRFYAVKSKEATPGNDIYFGSLTGGDVACITAETMGRGEVRYSVLPGTDYLVFSSLNEEDLYTTIYDLSRQGVSCPMAQYDYVTSTLDAIYLEQEQLIFGLRPDEYYFAPVVIDPKVLSFGAEPNAQAAQWEKLVDEERLEAYQQEKAGPALPVQLQTQRERADALEEKYGIHILIGQQICGPWGAEAQVEEGPAYIDAALTQLDTALSLYPGGFLSQFRNDIKEGGIYLCLTGRINGELSPVGRTKPGGDRYDIAIDVTSDGLDRTIHHELWHTIEMKLSTDSFAHPQWEACNPEDFQYYGSYDSGYGTQTEHTFEKSGSDCYFVDAYSKINGTEDRARLMENVMTTDAAELLQSNALQKKLQIMSKSIRDHFNTENWQTPYWERYF